VNRSPITLSGVYLKLAWLNPVTWMALAGALLYTLLATTDSIVALQSRGVSLQLIEIGLYVFNDSYLLTYGLLLTFTIMASSLFDAPDTERLFAYRMPGRRDIWAARMLALLGLSGTFLVAVGAVFLVAALPHHTASFAWSDSYRQVLSLTSASPEGLDPVFYLAADKYLFASTTPMRLLGIQGALFLLVFWAVGVLCTVVGQAVQRRSIALAALLLYLFVYLGANQIGYPALSVATPQGALLVGAHTPQSDSHVSFAVSFALWLCLLGASTAIGHFQTRRAGLG